MAGVSLLAEGSAAVEEFSEELEESLQEKSRTRPSRTEIKCFRMF
jgi:hypothetical protein